jgi:CheY-like chemotaxis protein
VILTRDSLRQNENNFQVDVASNSDECLNKLRENSYDVILLDYSLPKVDGLTLLDKISQQPLLIFNDSKEPSKSEGACKGK